MVKYADILKAINDKIKSKFPAIEIVSESDIEEKIIRPSFMVMLDGIKAEDFMSVCADKEMTARIHYFSTKAEKNKLENLKMLDDLEDLFLNRTLELSNFNINVEDYDVNFPDKVLEYSFNLSFSEDYERTEIDDNTEMMEEIYIKQEE
jgi:hypothetical protein